MGVLKFTTEQLHIEFAQLRIFEVAAGIIIPGLVDREGDSTEFDC